MPTMALGLLLLLLLKIWIVPSYSNQCNSLAMNHIPPPNETKTLEDFYFLLGFQRNGCCHLL